mgnify:CR=1 FL=1
MTLFLDTTALLARFLEGPARPVVLDAMRSDRDWCASALALSEALMLVDRLGDDPERTDELRRAIRDDWERINVVPVDQRIEEAGVGNDHAPPLPCPPRHGDEGSCTAGAGRAWPPCLDAQPSSSRAL